MFYLDNSNIHGKGVFTRYNICTDTLFEYPILVLSNKEVLKLQSTKLADKLFAVKDSAGLVLSPLSMANHSNCPNMDYKTFNDTIIFKCIRNILADEEILIDYKDFARVLRL